MKITNNTGHTVDIPIANHPQASEPLHPGASIEVQEDNSHYAYYKEMAKVFRLTVTFPPTASPSIPISQNINTTTILEDSGLGNKISDTGLDIVTPLPGESITDPKEFSSQTGEPSVADSTSGGEDTPSEDPEPKIEDTPSEDPEAKGEEPEDAPSVIDNPTIERVDGTLEETLPDDPALEESEEDPDETEEADDSVEPSAPRSGRRPPPPRRKAE